jgi:hypothetical protein
MQHGPNNNAYGDEVVRCPACGLELPRAILMPRYCPRCVARRRRLVKLQSYSSERGAASTRRW